MPIAGPGAECFTSAKKIGIVPAPGSARSSGTSIDPHSVSGGSSQGCEEIGLRGGDEEQQDQRGDEQ